MVSQLLKLFIISLPALARSQAQAQPNRLSVSISSSISSTEAHNNTTSTNVQYTTDLPSGSTLIPDANGGNGGIGVNPNPIVNPPTNSTMPSDTNSGNNHNATAIPKKTGARKLAGYYPVYNAEGQPLSELRYDLYDEISFFAATTNANFTIGTDSLTQNEWDTLAFDFVNSCNNHSVFPSYTVGGWGGSRYFSSLVATAENRTAFANSTITFAKKYGFKGIDFDWEYAGIQGIGCNIVSDEDVQNQQLLFKEVKSQWPEGKLSTTQSIAGIRDPNYQRLPASDVTVMAQVVDEVRIMAYDVHGSFTKTTGPNAPIRAQCADPENQLSVESAIEIYLKQGFRPEQLSLGIPGYAKSWTLTKPELTPRIVGNYTSYYYQNYTGIPAGGKFDDQPGLDVCGQKTGYGGSWLVNELVDAGFLSDDETSGGKGFTRYYDACSGEPFLASNSTLISYDDTESTVSKVIYAKSKGLAGVFFFDTMGPRDKTVKAARTALLD
ncbi:uncharacterized protein PGTG_15914 [Puccinia graminis f. sp. tritici CRL 75-36-700-3]|uniref:GH18 domain-containing protein n=1 Tax=Puccinia graminis f. sp. tritici (strain CRL 75-36-700-3 / race SCCL) TaxID=418459 RepID=E3L0G8_PUCGT|nr:uncharacterized protein PGTG_15914 [Puccinia graminis f. sp. tritici CRL 75-36-700-3]EFP90066.2 hypothetical protein PGTG_15914 [Puccinia graminis f. sp. tritici CRL 75-36-700-3]